MRPNPSSGFPGFAADVAPDTFDAIVLGGGAAGLMFALCAGERGRRVLVLERAERTGKKILISGGGRCNFTNLHTGPENFLSRNPHFAKSALAGYQPADFVRWVESHRIAYHEKKLGQLFCDGSAAQIVNALEQDARSRGATVLCQVRVEQVERPAEYVVRTNAGVFRGRALVVATGGLSIPKMGATGFGYELARQFGHAVVECRPALVPLVLEGEDAARLSGLSGIAADVVARANRHAFRENLLITHRGLSGPAVLQVSSYLRPGEPMVVDFAPGENLLAEVRARAQRDRGMVVAALKRRLPTRLAERMCDWFASGNWTNRDLRHIEERLHQCSFIPAGNEGYAKAEVTAGGVDTAELSPRTLESKLVPGLYFIGEVVDVTGQLGGFNFQWAWASAYAAAQHL